MDINTLRMYYVTARNATIIGENDAEAIENLYKLYKYVEELFERGSIVEKILSKQLYAKMSDVMARMKQNGLRDPAVLAFFGIKYVPKPEPVATTPATPVAPPQAESSAPVSEDADEGSSGLFDILGESEEPIDVTPEAPIDVTPEAPVDTAPEAPIDTPVDDVTPDAPVEASEGETYAPVVENDGDEAVGEVEMPVIEDDAGDADAGDSYVAEEEAEDPNRIKAPQMLDDFIGQADIVKRLKKEIAVAKKRGIKYLSNILLFGNRGLGKTTLMQIIANELGVRFEWIDASQFQSSHTSEKQFLAFLQNISMANEPVVIGIDEIHALPKKIQSSLLTLLQSRVFVYMDNSGHNHNIPIEAFTFIGATTDPQDVLDTIQDRCKNLTFTLKDYTHDELMLIFKRKFASKKLQISDELIERCIARCRCSIREVEAIVLGLLTEADYIDTRVITEDILEEYFKVRGVDEIGLEQTDIDILRAIATDPAGVVSADTLASKMGMDVKVLLSKFEPYLIKIGFVTIINRGRAITDLGRAHLRKLDGDDGAGADSADAPNSDTPSDVSAPEAPIDVTPESPIEAPIDVAPNPNVPVDYTPTPEDDEGFAPASLDMPDSEVIDDAIEAEEKPIIDTPAGETPADDGDNAPSDSDAPSDNGDEDGDNGDSGDSDYSSDVINSLK